MNLLVNATYFFMICSRENKHVPFFKGVAVFFCSTKTIRPHLLIIVRSLCCEAKKIPIGLNRRATFLWHDIVAARANLLRNVGNKHCVAAHEAFSVHHNFSQ